MILYFLIMWSGAFGLVFYLSRRNLKEGEENMFGYEMAVVQSFTAGSNNFVCDSSSQPSLINSLTRYV